MRAQKNIRNLTTDLGSVSQSVVVTRVWAKLNMSLRQTAIELLPNKQCTREERV